MRAHLIALYMGVASLGSHTGPGAEGKQPPDTTPTPATRPTATADPPASDAHWIPLFNGRNLDGWYTFLQKHGKNSDPDHVVTIKDGAIHLYNDANDGDQVVMGYIATEKEHANYHLRLQYRWGAKKFAPRYKLKRDAGLYYHIIGPDAVWPRSLQYQIQQTDAGDLIALHGFTLDTWIDSKTRDAAEPTYQDPERGGEPRVLGGKGKSYQKRQPGDFEVDGWNVVEVIARADSTIHLLNGHVANQGRNIRLVSPEKPGESQPITRSRIALEIEAAELYFRNVELRNLTRPN
jgi:hypothetical protein